MEAYREIDQHDVKQDSKRLASEQQIEEYFKKNYSGLFDCGLGYCQEVATVIVKIGERLFETVLYPKIGSSKQDGEDRLYWVESIENVEFEEIEVDIVPIV